MQFTTGDGSSIHYETVGDGAPVVLLHGIIGDVNSWRFQRSLALRCRLISMDARGLGRSTGGPDHYEMADLAGDVVALLDVLGYQQATIVGLSMGGGVAQELLSQHRARVRSAVLVSTTPGFPDDIRERFRREAAAVQAAGIEPWVDIWMQRWLTASFRAAHPEIAAEERHTIERTSPQVYATRGRINAGRDYTRILTGCPTPVTYVGGREDPINRRDIRAAFATIFPTFRSTLIDDAGHLVPIEQPERFNGAIADHLDWVG